MDTSHPQWDICTSDDVVSIGETLPLSSYVGLRSNVDEFNRKRWHSGFSTANSDDAIDVLSDLFILRGLSAHGGNGLSSSPKAVQVAQSCGAQSQYLPDGPWENGYSESSNARLLDEFLNGQIEAVGTASRLNGPLTATSNQIKKPQINYI